MARPWFLHFLAVADFPKPFSHLRQKSAIFPILFYDLMENTWVEFHNGSTLLVKILLKALNHSKKSQELVNH